jgi:hypothetical protein
MTAAEFVKRLTRVRRSGGGWSAECPSHHDRQNSLSVTQAPDKILLNDHSAAACTADQICKALGLQLSDLFTRNGTAKSKAVTRYEIRDAQGKLIAVHVRLDLPNGKKQMPWELPDGTKGLGGLRTVDLPLYGTEHLASLSAGETIVVVEGEKCADRLRRMRINAVGTVTGAGKTKGKIKVPSDDSLKPLLGFAEIVLWPDNDVPGLEHMSGLGERLLVMGLPNNQLQWLDPALVSGLAGQGSDAADLGDDQVRDALDVAVVAFGIAVATQNSTGQKTSEQAKVENWCLVFREDDLDQAARDAVNADPDCRTHLIGLLRELRARLKGTLERLADPPMVDPSQALEVAEAYIAHNRVMGSRTIHRHLEDFYSWDGAAYRKMEREETEAAVARLLIDYARTVKWMVAKADKRDPGTWYAQEVNVTPKQIADATRMLLDRVHITLEPPCWVAPRSTLFAGWSGVVEAILQDAIPCRNGILLSGNRTLLPPHPDFFNLNALGVDYEPAAKCSQWRAFIQSLWPDDDESINCLQEMFGYMISGEMRLEKMFMLIGPPRSGKGTIASTLKGLLGDKATASIGLSKLTEGLESQIIIGRQLVIIPDARMGKKTDTAKLMDALLSIRGGDNPSVARKFRDAYEGKLHARILILTNITPRFPDDSGATANRFIIWKTMRTFLGRENR